MAAGMRGVERLKDYGQMQAYLQAMEVFDAGYDIQ